MTSKTLKAFSIISFCLFFVSYAIVILGIGVIDGDISSSVSLSLFVITTFVGFIFAIVELVQGHKNKKNGQKGGIKGLSIAGLVLNSINMLISLLIIFGLTLYLIEDVIIPVQKYKIPSVQKQYRGAYISRDYYDTLSRKESYIDCFERNDEKLIVYEVEKNYISKIEKTNTGKVDKKIAKKFNFSEHDVVSLTTDENEEFVRICDKYSYLNLSATFLKFYCSDYDSVFADYDFVLYPHMRDYEFNNTPDFVVRKNTNEYVEECFTVKKFDNLYDLRELVYHQVESDDEDCPEPHYWYEESEEVSLTLESK